MDARVRAAELELSRGEELHKLRVQHLKLQIMKQERLKNQESSYDREDHYEHDDNLQQLPVINFNLIKKKKKFNN